MERIATILIIGLLLAPWAFAEDKKAEINFDAEIQKRQMQVQSLQWEHKYHQERLKVLELMAQDIQSAIKALQKQKADKKAAIEQGG